MDPAHVIGKRIRDRLALLGKTQSWLADEVGVSQATVSRWVKGKDCPSRFHEPKVVRALHAEGTGLFDLTGVAA